MQCESFLVPAFEADCSGHIPSARECYQLWDQYNMLDHIRIHSRLVALVASEVASLLKDKGLQVQVQAVLAAGLLHDLAKSYTLKYGGNHSQIGASWVMLHTGNPAIAQGVLHHPHWPGALEIKKHALPLCLVYADKRVMHDQIVTLQERFSDLLNRYGSTRIRVDMMQNSFTQALEIQRLLNSMLEVDLDAYPFDSRRLVE